MALLVESVLKPLKKLANWWDTLMQTLKSEKLACDYQCRQFESINDLLENQSVQTIVVSTLHDTLTDLTIRSLAAGKYVLVEKPAARNKNELEKVIQQQSKSTAKVRVGLNHRYHPAIQRLNPYRYRGNWKNFIHTRPLWSRWKNRV